MASKSNGVETEWARAPPPNVPFGERCLKAIYNPDENTFLGRTPKRWGILIIFYLVFYAVLALLFAVCMAGLFSVLEDDKPVFILESSLIGANPGVACRPQVEGTVQYNTDNSTAHETYTRELEEFFELYKDDRWYKSKNGCKAEDNFGFPQSPCFFVKLNKIYGWKPEYMVEFTGDMSQELNDSIQAETDRKQIWVSCWEEHSNETTIEYPWGQGLPGSFYPFLNQKGYLSPIVAVKLTPPAGVTAKIRCRAWAKNIVYNKSLKEPSGYTRILLQIDGNATSNATA